MALKSSSGTPTAPSQRQNERHNESRRLSQLRISHTRQASVWVEYSLSIKFLLQLKKKTGRNKVNHNLLPYNGNTLIGETPDKEPIVIDFEQSIITAMIIPHRINAIIIPITIQPISFLCDDFRLSAFAISCRPILHPSFLRRQKVVINKGKNK